MFPSKNMMDYMTEINRLFPKTPEIEQSPNPQSGYVGQPSFQPTIGNQSSSSADSTSPESFPDITGIQFRPYTPIPDCQPIPDTPFPVRRQRPIMGRRIMSADHSFDVRPQLEPRQISPIKVVDTDVEMRRFWPQDLLSMYPQTPTKHNRMLVEQKTCNPNVFYELFPAENKGFELKTPDKNISSPQTSRFSSANISPSSGISVSPISPVPQRFMTPPPQYRRNFHMPASSRPNEDVDGGRVCSFCRKNGETPLVYMTHTVKERVGNRHIVTCPILRSHVCSTCHATGDVAHTITYCPVLRNNNNGLPLQSTTITLKNTRVKSNGRKRY